MSDFPANQQIVSQLLDSGCPEATTCSLMIGRCGNCSRDLQWPVPRANAWASAVACPECGRYYFTQGRSSHPARLLPEWASLELDDAVSDWLSQLRAMDLDQLSSGAVVRQIVGTHHQTNERRAHIRFDIENVIVGIPLDQQARPTGMALDVTLMDLSASGMQLIALGSWKAPLVAVDFTKLGLPGTQLIASVVWQTSQGAMTRLGCRFLTTHDGQLPLE